MKENFGNAWNTINVDLSDCKTLGDIIVKIQNRVEDIFNELKSTKESSFVSDFSRKLLFFLVDNNWQEQMIQMDELKQGIGLRAFASENPIDVYKKEAFDLFEGMLYSMKEEVLNTFMGIYETEHGEQNAE